MCLFIRQLSEFNFRRKPLIPIDHYLSIATAKKASIIFFSHFSSSNLRQFIGVYDKFAYFVPPSAGFCSRHTSGDVEALLVGPNWTTFCTNCSKCREQTRQSQAVQQLSSFNCFFLISFFSVLSPKSVCHHIRRAEAQLEYE